MKNEMLRTVGVAVITSVIVFFVLYFMMQQVMFGPDTGRAVINANECRADVLCEINNTRMSTAKIEGQLTLTRVGDAEGVYLFSERGNLYINPDNFNTKLLGNFDIVNINGISQTTFTTNRLGSLVVTPTSGATEINGDLSISNLTGAGNAYACVNSAGRFYRSISPCL